MILEIVADHVSSIKIGNNRHMLVIINLVGDIPKEFDEYNQIHLDDCNGNFVSTHSDIQIFDVMDATRIHDRIKRITHISYNHG
jgi:hypothetical protein